MRADGIAKVTNNKTSTCNNKVVYAKPFSTRVGILQRIVKAIAVTIKVLAIVWHLHIVVGTKETADNRIIQSTVHVDYVIFVEHLMTCVAPIKPDVVLRNGLFTPRIVRSIEHLSTFFIEHRKYAAKVIGKGKIRLPY